VAASSAPASFVLNINPSNGIGTNANLVSYDFTDNPDDTVGPLNDPGPLTNEDYVGPGPGNLNFVDMEFDVLQQDAPFNVRLNRAGGPTQAAEYWFEVTVNNLTSGTIKNLDIALLSAPDGSDPAVLARHDIPSVPAPTGGTYTRISDSLASFGNLLIAPGASQTLGFSLDFLADLVGPFGDQNRPVYIQFTATPEPHGLLLGGLCLLAFVGIVLQRRRQAALARVSSNRPAV
jgi:hypothetical protein